MKNGLYNNASSYDPNNGPPCPRWCPVCWAGARPINVILMELEIRPKFAVLKFKICSNDHNEILHKSLQLHCCDVC